MSKKVLVIIPLHKKDSKVFRAIASVPKEWELIVSVPNKEVFDFVCKDELKTDEPRFRTLVHSQGSSLYQDLVNEIISTVDEPFDYITILEYDDTFSQNVLKVVEDYADDETEILCPLACVVKESDDKPILLGMVNEAAFAAGMAEKYGYFDFNMLLRSNFIFVNGSFIKPHVFKEYGAFKKNFKMFHDYEWALRMVYNGVIIKAAPKASHIHYLYDDSMFDEQKNADPKIRQKWLEASRREYFFEDDRELNIS